MTVVQNFRIIWHTRLLVDAPEANELGFIKMTKEMSLDLIEAVTDPESTIIWLQPVQFAPDNHLDEGRSTLTFKILGYEKVIETHPYKVFYRLHFRAFCHAIPDIGVAEKEITENETPWPTNTGVVVVVAKDEGEMEIPSKVA